MIARSGTRGLELVAEVAYAPGQLIHRIVPHTVSARPDRWSIQIGPDRHIMDPAISNMNHSCEPNAIVDTPRLKVFALRAIEPGDEITFFYPSTEWDMDQPFECLCGAAGCLGYIAGAKHLPAATLERYFVNPHIRALVLSKRNPEEGEMGTESSWVTAVRGEDSRNEPGGDHNRF